MTPIAMAIPALDRTVARSVVEVGTWEVYAGSPRDPRFVSGAPRFLPFLGDCSPGYRCVPYALDVCARGRGGRSGATDPGSGGGSAEMRKTLLPGLMLVL